MYLAYALTVVNLPNFPHQKLLPVWFAKHFPCQIFPVYGRSLENCRLSNSALKNRFHKSIPVISINWTLSRHDLTWSDMSVQTTLDMLAAQMYIIFVRTKLSYLSAAGILTLMGSSWKEFGRRRRRWRHWGWVQTSIPLWTWRDIASTRRPVVNSSNDIMDHQTSCDLTTGCCLLLIIYVDDECIFCHRWCNYVWLLCICLWKSTTVKIMISIIITN